MIQMTGMRLPIAQCVNKSPPAIDLVLQVASLSDGTRRLTSISEITGMEGDTITMQEIFMYERREWIPGTGHRSFPSNWYTSALRRDDSNPAACNCHDLL